MRNASTIVTIIHVLIWMMNLIFKHYSILVITVIMRRETLTSQRLRLSNSHKCESAEMLPDYKANNSDR